MAAWEAAAPRVALRTTGAQHPLEVLPALPDGHVAEAGRGPRGSDWRHPNNIKGYDSWHQPQQIL
jgi:hypothetical protein